MRIAKHREGPVVAVAFAGKYPPGSGGNECARDMVSHLSSVVGETSAAAVLLDFRNLDYTYGDAICGLARPLRWTESRFRPSAIVATGATAEALEPLLGPGWLFGVVGTKMFRDMPEAIAYLEEVLERETG
jgi:hypothetical protein